MTSLEASMNQPGGNPIVQRLVKLGLPLTVENYLNFDWPDGPPKPVPTELLVQAEQALAQANPAKN